MDMSVSLFIKFHKLGYSVIHNNHNYSILVFVKGVKYVGKQTQIHEVYCKTVMIANYVDE